MNYIIFAKNVYLSDRIEKDYEIVITNGLISNEPDVNEIYERIELNNLTLVPGLIDIHVHGGNGFDTMDNDMNSIKEISKYKILEGVTSFCPTTVTTSLEKTKDAIKIIKKSKEKGVNGAKIVGAFLEGPYINPVYKGAHPQEYIRDINMEEIKELYETGKDSITSFALAPELENASEAIKYLVRNKVNVRIGHSNATLSQANYAIELGTNIGIHTFNAMSPLNHREPGMVGAIFLNENIYAELICDLIHVDPSAIKILIAAKGIDKIILVTDCMQAGGLPDGDYKLGELDVYVCNKIARTQSGALAGSTLKLIEAVSNMTKVIGLSLFESIKMVTENPAKALSIFDNVGSLCVGKKADLVGLDDELVVKFVMVDGNIMLETR